MMAIDMDLTADGGRHRRFARLRDALSTWLGRARDRRALAAMDDRALRDLGLARCEISAEIARWRRRP
jgi:uncharacterized protein YjiS (DUF1127 family)